MRIQTNAGSGAGVHYGEVIAPSAPPLIQRLGQVIAAVVLQRAMWKAEAELMALSDRTLKDIGLPRGEIRSAIRDAFARAELDAGSSILARS